MTKSPPKNIGASVRARLLHLEHERGDDFQLLLLRYANERLLFRLASSRHAQHFVLKGAATSNEPTTVRSWQSDSRSTPCPN